MIFRTYKTELGGQIFAAEVAESELYDSSLGRSVWERFHLAIWDRIGNMVAAYYFKHHRNEIMKWLETEDARDRIARAIADRIELNLK